MLQKPCGNLNIVIKTCFRKSYSKPLLLLTGDNFAGSFSVSLFIDLGCPSDLWGTFWLLNDTLWPIIWFVYQWGHSCASIQTSNVYRDIIFLCSVMILLTKHKNLNCQMMIKEPPKISIYLCSKTSIFIFGEIFT